MLWFYNTTKLLVASLDSFLLW